MSKVLMRGIAGAVAGTALLAGSAGAWAAEAPAAAEPSSADVVERQAQEARAIVEVPDVQGRFAFSQDVLTSNAAVKNIFQKATAILCNTPSVYDNALNEFLIAVGGDVPHPYSATLTEVEQEKGGSTHIMACSCTANSVGGSAIAASEVHGVSIAAMAEKAGL